MRPILKISSAVYGLAWSADWNINLLSLCFPSVTLESPAESESNVESNSDGSEDEAKEQGETDADSDAEKTSLKLAKEPSSIHKSSLKISAKSSHPNLPIIKPPSLSSRLFAAPTVTSLGALSNRTILSPSSLFTAMSGMKSAFA